MRHHAAVATGFLAFCFAPLLLTAASTQEPAPAFRDVLARHVGQTAGFHASEGAYLLHFPEDPRMSWQSTELVAVGADFIEIRWKDQRRHIPIARVELLVAAAK